MLLSAVALLLALQTAVSAPASQGNLSVPEATNEASVRPIQKKWVNRVMLEVLPDFIPHSKTNEECNRQAELYRLHLSNLTLWAVAMYESSAYSENGVLAGNEFTVGGFDECIRINVPDEKLAGKYCQPHLKFTSNYFNIEERQRLADFKNISPYASAWKKIQKVVDERIKYRDWFAWGICIPSGCDSRDLEESLKEALIPALNRSGIIAEVTVDDDYCTVYDHTTTIGTGGYVFVLTLVSLTLIMIISTAVHYLYMSSFDSTKDDSSIILFFSAISNTRRLIQHEEKADFRLLSGIKVITMFLIIFGHRFLMSYYWPFLNVEDQEMGFEMLYDMIVVNGTIIVNTFLFITGFLVFSKLLNDIKKKRKINIPLYIIYRWLRIVPVYLFIISIYVFLKPAFTNEMFYKVEGRFRVETCTKYWWTYILFVNNYYGSDSECLVPAWYLAVDMQLYIVCVIVGFILSKSKKAGYTLLGFFLAMSQIIPAIVSYLKGYLPLLRFYINYMDNYYRQEDFVNSYVPTHMRAGPYFIGMLFAVILVKMKEREFKFKSYHLVIGAIFCCSATFGVLLYAYEFYLPDTPINLMESSLYVTIHRILWAVAMGWIVLFGVIHPDNKLFSFLRLRCFAPLNKLMLNALLVHSAIQGETILLQRNPEYINAFILAWKTAGDCTVTYIISYGIHLILDAPLARLQDFTLKKIFKNTLAKKS